ncbi:MAG: hypothetical protein LBC88_01800 [Spirochaetaceae bacterium]|jgi:hypothetical protein|nr:hypothetical protein [Spirochaetaceae bacterium]
MNFKPGLIAAAAGFMLSLAVGLIAGAGLFAVVRALVFAAFFFVLVSGLGIAVGRFLPELLNLSDPNAGYGEAGYGGANYGGAVTGEDGEAAGSRVNIAVEGDVSSPAFGGVSGGDMEDGAFSSDSALEDEDDDFDPDSPVPSPALDQFNEDEYTESGDFSAPASPSGVFTPGLPGVRSGGGGLPPGGKTGAEAAPGAGGGRGASPARPERKEDADTVDMLPDLEAMSQAFLASTQEAEQSGDSGNDGGGGTGNPFDGGGSPDTSEEVFEVSVSGQGREPAPYIGNKPAALKGDFPPKDIAQAIQTLLKRDE